MQRGFGFVQMSNDTESDRAITKLNGRDFDGRALNVNQTLAKTGLESSATPRSRISFATRAIVLAYGGFTLGLHRFHQIGRGCSFERESIANFPHEALFERLNEVYTRVAACHLRCL
jgi:RNA recognition motif-containing protein